MSQPPTPPQWSSDGRYWWNGQKWIEASQARPAALPLPIPAASVSPRLGALPQMGDRIRVSPRQFEAGDFPPVCAFTGHPAETTGRVLCVEPGDWIVIVIWLAIGIFVPRWKPRVAVGRLPFTLQARKAFSLADTAIWTGALLTILAEIAGIWVFLSTKDPDIVAIARTLMVIGVVTAAAFLTGIVLSRAVLPHGFVLYPEGSAERVVELRRVHPAFVAAASQHQRSALTVP